MSDDFERRWRHEMMSVEQLEAEVDALRAAETDARRAIDDIKTRLVTLAPDETSALVAVEGGDRAGDTGGGAETEVGHGAGHDRESDADVAIDKDAPEVIDLRDRRSDLEDRLSRLAAELDDVRRELSSDEE